MESAEGLVSASLSLYANTLKHMAQLYVNAELEGHGNGLESRDDGNALGKIHNRTLAPASTQKAEGTDTTCRVFALFTIY